MIFPSLVYAFTGDLNDPAITPRKAIPALTETMSPQPEIPSKYLDLSDEDLASSQNAMLNKLQPVMVCDASYLSSSSNHTEVDVVVNYEDSPAKVVCHTSERLEDRSFHSNSNSSFASKRSISNRINSGKTSGLAPSSLFLSGSVDSPAESISQEKSGLQISSLSKGLIKEILDEEMGSGNVDGISLSSQNSSSPHLPSPSHPQKRTTGGKYPRNSSPIEESIENYSLKNVGRSVTNSISSNSSLSTKEQTKSIPDHYAQKKSTDVKEKPLQHEVKSMNSKVNSDDSASENLSLYEYVTTKKPTSAKKSKCSSTASLLDRDNLSITKSAKKTKQKKTVPSRYNQNITSKTPVHSLEKEKNSHPSSAQSALPQSNLLQQQHRESAISRAVHSTQRKAKLGRKISSKTVASQTFAKNHHSNKSCSSSRQESPKAALNEQSRSPKTHQKTSTPTHDCNITSMFPNYADASSIHSVSALLNDISVTTSSKLSEMSLTKPSASKQKVETTNSKKALQIQLEIDYTKYIQACFLNSEARKGYKEQEKNVTKDLHSLWTLVEQRREEVSKAENELERLKQMLREDKFMDKTESELNSLIPKLPQVEEDFRKLCEALDTTMHQIPTKDIFLPDSEDDVLDGYEGKMASVLKESEMLLNEINDIMSTKVHPLTQYKIGLEAVQHNVDAIGAQLREGQNDLEETQSLFTRLASLAAVDNL